MPSRSYLRPNDFDHIFRLLDERPEQHGEHFSRRALIRRNSDLAFLIGVSPSLIEGILADLPSHYRAFQIRKASGSFREIHSPRTYLKVIQWWILDNVLSGVELPEFVHGFAPGKSPYTNAVSHVGQNHILKLDISDFFPSVRVADVESVFGELGYSNEVSRLLAQLCTLEGGLPQGAPTSPAVSNLFFRNLDYQIENEAKKVGLRYTRYADDLTFSSSEFIDSLIVSKIAKLLGAAGLQLNDKKTHFRGPLGRQKVTGFVLGREARLPRTWRKNARAAFHQASTDPARYASRIDYLNGLLGLISSLPEEADSKLFRQAQAAVEEVRSHLSSSLPEMRD